MYYQGVFPSVPLSPQPPLEHASPIFVTNQLLNADMGLNWIRTFDTDSHMQTTNQSEGHVCV